jgi:hypothetical protein
MSVIRGLADRRVHLMHDRLRRSLAQISAEILFAFGPPPSALELQASSSAGVISLSLLVAACVVFDFIRHCRPVRDRQGVNPFTVARARCRVDRIVYRPTAADRGVDKKTRLWMMHPTNGL